MGKAEQRMDGKRVLVTGSGTGIGRGVALEFSRRGADVVFHYSHSATGALSAVAEVQEAGGKAAAFAADFADVQQVRGLAAQALEFLGGIDVLVNNAGISLNMPFEDVTAEQFDTLYSVNIKAMFFLTQACASEMIRTGKGVVINVSSIHAVAGMTEHSVYAGTKGAIVAFSRQLAVELAPRGVRVNSLIVGGVTVENTYKVIPGFDAEEAGKTVPVGFVGKPVDIGNVAVFLASDEARYICGHGLVIDGGTTAVMALGQTSGEPLGWCFGKGYVPGV